MKKASALIAVFAATAMMAATAGCSGGNTPTSSNTQSVQETTENTTEKATEKPTEPPTEKPTEDPQCEKTSGYNENLEIKRTDFIKSYQLYCYSRKDYNIVRAALAKDKHKTKVFDVSVYAL